MVLPWLEFAQMSIFRQYMTILLLWALWGLRVTGAKDAVGIGRLLSRDLVKVVIRFR